MSVQQPSVLQPVAAGLIGAFTGFASSFALVLAGLLAVGASPAEAASGLLVLSVGQGLVAIPLSLAYRMPISIAWSTPGAAVLIAARGITGDFGTAVGAFIVSGLLIVIAGLWPWLADAVTRIPRSIASAMLAGILFPICLSPVLAAVQLPLAAIPPILVWLVLFRFARRWAVPAAMLATAVAIGILAGTEWLGDAALWPQVSLVLPVFDPVVIVGLGIPLFIVTMAGQNVPGLVVLRTFGYERPPTRAILVSTGAATVVGSIGGGYALNLAAITAAIMAGPDAHPDPARRWIASLTGGITYIVLGLGAGVATALVSASPPVLIESVAGLAVLGALVSSITSALEDADGRIVAILTFLVVASGITVLGIGSAFWGLVVGGILYLWLRPKRQKDA
jgi:benzoate membrane transport protein